MEQFDIAICGYGPVGSTFAGLMGKLGHKVLVIEKNIGPSPTARAINTDGEQLRTFDRLGIAEKVVENSHEVHCVHFGDGYKQLSNRLGSLLWVGLIKFCFINLN